MANIFVTQPSLAPLEEYTKLLEGVWERGILTHNGPLVQQLEKDIAHKLGIQHFVAVNNGTIAIQMAIKALNLPRGGEIITTPFTWVATISAIMWEGLTPVFCDIDKETLNMDVAKIEACITNKTVAIMPVHVFGNPCDVTGIDVLAKKHGLQVIYDGAHAIGTTMYGKSVLEYGDISATSLHATKLLNTGEGGGCITTNEALAKKLQRIRFFGHSDDKTDIVEEGFNGKLTEIHAALGIANIKYYDAVLEDRKNKYLYYFNKLQSADIPLEFQKIQVGGTCNYSYFPIIFPSENALLNVEKQLREKGIYARRYFYPSVNTFTQILSYQPAPIAEDIAKRILCLPLYFNLTFDQIDLIINTIIA